MLKIKDGEVNASGTPAELVQDWIILSDALFQNMAKELNVSKHYVMSETIDLLKIHAEKKNNEEQ